jgi:putative PIN family toxin of toxin-antitoxin system
MMNVLILDLEESRQIKFAFSKQTKNELYRIITKKVEEQNIFECSDFFENLQLLISRSRIIEHPSKLEKLSSDKGDQPFIELAVAAKANFLITNDYQNGLLDLKIYKEV